MLWCSGLWTNWATARPSRGVFPYEPLLMMMICAPSQVMREGRDLNQQGQAARQEQASSSSPETFHEVLASALAACVVLGRAVMPQTSAAARIEFISVIFFISFLLNAETKITGWGEGSRGKTGA